MNDTLSYNLIGIRPNELMNDCVAKLDRVFERYSDVHALSTNTASLCDYYYRLLTAQTILTLLVDPKDKEPLRRFRAEYSQGSIYFVVANWLNWEQSVCLYDRYGLQKPTKNSVGFVLSYPIQVIAASCVITGYEFDRSTKIISGETWRSIEENSLTCVKDLYEMESIPVTDGVDKQCRKVFNRYQSRRNS